jgi:hypothetical protein
MGLVAFAYSGEPGRSGFAAGSLEGDTMITRVITRVLLLLVAMAVVPPALPDSEGPVVLVKASDGFDDVKENIVNAITNRGLLTSGELHVSEMLNRTGPDLGFEPPVYVKAESVEFCSALMSHKMTQVDPVNLVICPFTIAVFIKTNEPEQVYVAFRRQSLAGPAEAVESEVNQLLQEIVSEALE